MAWWESDKSSKEEIIINHDVAWGVHNQLNDDIVSVYNDLIAEGAPTWAFSFFNLFVVHHENEYYWWHPIGYVGDYYMGNLEYYLINHAANMECILSNMMKATIEQFTKFIGIEDAYRCAIWESPFNIEYYAFLARLFRYW